MTFNPVFGTVSKSFTLGSFISQIVYRLVFEHFLTTTSLNFAVFGFVCLFLVFVCLF